MSSHADSYFKENISACLHDCVAVYVCEFESVCACVCVREKGEVKMRGLYDLWGMQLWGWAWMWVCAHLPAPQLGLFAPHWAMFVAKYLHTYTHIYVHKHAHVYVYVRIGLSAWSLTASHRRGNCPARCHDYVLPGALLSYN